MKGFTKEGRFLKLASATIAVLATMGFSGCGGGGDKGSTSSGAVSHAGPAGGSPSTQKIHVEGVSQSIDRSTDVVDVMVPPVSWAADGSFTSAMSFVHKIDQPISALRELAPGAYTSMPFRDGTIDLLSGTVTDIAGNGQFAIGRWTAGSDTAGHTYNANQGQAWAVGIPLSVSLPESTTMNCSLVASTRPTAGDGNTAPGKLLSGSATLSAGFDDVLKRPKVNVELELRYSIGGDVDQSFAEASMVGAVTASATRQMSMTTMLAGTHPSNPYLLVSYGAHAPTVGVVNGIAVLSCE